MDDEVDEAETEGEVLLGEEVLSVLFSSRVKCNLSCEGRLRRLSRLRLQLPATVKKVTSDFKNQEKFCIFRSEASGANITLQISCPRCQMDTPIFNSFSDFSNFFELFNFFEFSNFFEFCKLDLIVLVKCNFAASLQSPKSEGALDI